MASGGHPCPSLLGQTQVSVLFCSPQGGYWGIFFFLDFFQFQSGQPLQREQFYTAASLSKCACSNALGSKMGFYVMLG